MKKENGEVLLEGMLVTLVSITVLVWILAVGFTYYQRYLVTAITNDAAVKIAATFNNPDSDIIMGYIEAEKLSERDLYRENVSFPLLNANMDKVSQYVTYRLNKTNFLNTIKDVDVYLDVIIDSGTRKHIEIKTTCTFNTPFASLVRSMGMSQFSTYSATSRADCTDIINYISTEDFSAALLSMKPFAKSDVIDIINTLIKLFNHQYTKA